MNATAYHEDGDTEGLQAQVERLRSELEQTHVELEDLDSRINALAAAKDDLEQRLRVERRLREAAERQVTELITAAQTPRPEQAIELELRQQLSVTSEELHVMADELQLAQEALHRHDSSPAGVYDGP
jgi:septal ring factor EnvC (AmiA/AmiB activator)